MASKQGTGLLDRIATRIVDKRGIIFGIFLVLALCCAFSRNWVKVNDSLTDYLPDDTETRQGLTIMDENFITYGTADIMVDSVSFEQAQQLAEALEQIDGVKDVDFDETASHYNDSAALFSITFEGTENDDISIQALADAEAQLEGYDTYVSSEVGNPLKQIIDREMLVVDLIAVAIIILVLLITSRTYGEIPVLLITFGAAALLNMGTNFLMGEISFVTDSIAIVMQLALAIDYAIILCHRYMDEHEKLAPREAAIVALKKAIPEISASSLTTVSGLLALCFMQYKLGMDMGSVLIKAILLSLASVFLLMPGLLVLFSGLIDRTHHKSFVPQISFLGRFAYKTRVIVPLLFVLIFGCAMFCSRHVNYVYSQYSVSSIRKNENQLAKEQIKKVFGSTTQMAIIIPSGDYDKEERLIEDIEECDQTDSVLGLSDIEAMDGYTLTSELTPRQFAELTGVDYEVAAMLYASYALDQDNLGQIASVENYQIPLISIFDYVCDKRYSVSVSMTKEDEDTLDDLEQQLDDAKAQLMNDTWSRIVVETTLPEESEESFEYLSVLRGITGRYYDKFYIVGDTTSCSDLQSSFEHDNLIISLLTVAFVIAVLIFSFKSAGLPVLLILIIEGSIMCNFSVPYLEGNNLFFLTYLIISAIQMGANIDYAIVISSRYMTLRECETPKDAMTQALNEAFPTIITSGLMLASAGIVIGLMTSNETISSIGIFLGTGTSISIVLVMFVLPQILLFGDTIIRKTSFEFGSASNTVQRTGRVRIDGHVRGTFNGAIDAEIHGYLRGDLNATVEMGALMTPENPETDADQSGNGAEIER